MSNQWSFLWAISNNRERFARDPVWRPSEEWIRENLGHLPTRFWEGVEDSLSEAHARFLVEQANRAHDIEQRLGSLGWGGVAANLAAAILDPAALALAIGSDGVLAPWLVAYKVSILGHMGIRTALAGMPSLRSLWRNARTGNLDDDLARELEVWVGLGTDRLRARQEFRHEDFGDYLDAHYGERMAWAQGLIEQGKVGIGELSGSNFVNTVLHRWAMRSAAQKFSDLADNPWAWNAARLNAYGLDPDSQIARDIFEAIRTHATRVNSALGGRKLTQLNLDQWPEDIAIFGPTGIQTAMLWMVAGKRLSLRIQTRGCSLRG